MISTEPVVKVTVVSIQGSAPTSIGNCLWVWPNTESGTIGGGHLEYTALQQAREWLHNPPSHPQISNIALTPAIDQCCGGRVALRFDYHATVDNHSDTSTPHMTVAIFGAGHVAQALLYHLQPLPWIVHIWDSRSHWLAQAPLPHANKHHLSCDHNDLTWQQLMHTLPADAHCLIMTHSHRLDLRLSQVLLAQSDIAVPFVGVIGSQTKRRRFRHQLQRDPVTANALARWHCPIGHPAIRGKDPQVIALSIMSQLLILS